jgi:hypothetical protein
MSNTSQEESTPTTATVAIKIRDLTGPLLDLAVARAHPEYKTLDPFIVTDYTLKECIVIRDGCLRVPVNPSSDIGGAMDLFLKDQAMLNMAPDITYCPRASEDQEHADPGFWSACAWHPIEKETDPEDGRAERVLISYYSVVTDKQGKLVRTITLPEMLCQLYVRLNTVGDYVLLPATEVAKMENQK